MSQTPFLHAAAKRAPEGGTACFSRHGNHNAYKQNELYVKEADETPGRARKMIEETNPHEETFRRGWAARSTKQPGTSHRGNPPVSPWRDVLGPPLPDKQRTTMRHEDPLVRRLRTAFLTYRNMPREGNSSMENTHPRSSRENLHPESKPGAPQALFRTQN